MSLPESMLPGAGGYWIAQCVSSDNNVFVFAVLGSLHDYDCPPTGVPADLYWTLDEEIIGTMTLS